MPLLSMLYLSARKGGGVSVHSRCVETVSKHRTLSGVAEGPNRRRGGRTATCEASRHNAAPGRCETEGGDRAQCRQLARFASCTTAGLRLVSPRYLPTWIVALAGEAVSDTTLVGIANVKTSLPTCTPALCRGRATETDRPTQLCIAD